MKTKQGSTRIALSLTAALLALGAAWPSPARADARVRLGVSVDTPVVLADRPQHVFLKVGLTGAPLEGKATRTPVNIAVVLDRSGSMAGDKIVKAREAAQMVVDRLSPDDIVSIVAFNHVVTVLVPATKVGDRAGIRGQIDRLFASGTTALFAGVSKGSYEVRKFLDRNRVNRVILMSDGQANVGPSSVGELADLGRSLGREGISVTTVGLGDGYNEDLMVALARMSDGNHGFAATAADLARIFNSELGDVTSVVAREVTVRIRCAPGVRPLRVLGRQAEIGAREVVASLAQVYANQEKYVLVEVEVPASAVGGDRDLADISVSWVDPLSKSRGDAAGNARITYSDRPALVEARRDRGVTEATVELIASENNEAAVHLRDQGKTEEARQALRANAAYLDNNAGTLKSPKLYKLKDANLDDLKNVDGDSWNVQRKVMRKRQFEVEQQQAW